MREDYLATRLSALVGAIVFITTLWIFTRILEMDIWKSLVFCLIATMVAGGITWIISFRKLQKHDEQRRKARLLQAEQEVAAMNDGVRKHIAQVREQAEQIMPYNPMTGGKLLKICHHSEIILQEVKEKRPDSSRQSLVVLGRNLEVLLTMALPQYRQIIDPDPEMRQYFPDGERFIQATDTTIDHMEQAFCSTVRMLEEEDINRLEIALKLLDPFDKSLLI